MTLAAPAPPSPTPRRPVDGAPAPKPTADNEPVDPVETSSTRRPPPPPRRLSPGHDPPDPPEARSRRSGEPAFRQAFEAWPAERVAVGEPAGRSADATGLAIVDRLADDALVAGADSFLFYGGCGSSLYADAVRAPAAGRELRRG